MSEIHSFSVINDYIRSKIGDGTICRSKNFSFLKILQHALSYNQTKNLNKISKNYLGHPVIIQLIVYWIKSFRKRGNTISLNEIVTLETNRTVVDDMGVSYSVYFENICSLIEKHRLTRLATVSTTSYYDYNLKYQSYKFPFPDARERKMIYEVFSIHRKWKNAGIFNREEMEYIQSALAVFLEEFRFYYNIFKHQPTKKIIFTCHYHKEGLIAAAKVLGIESIELQHGLITNNDIYYVYPQCYSGGLKNAFFPDRIFVFGAKWKEILNQGNEFDENQIVIAGDYTFHPKISSSPQSAKQNIILITSQKGIHEDYIGYCRILEKFLQLHPGWKVIIKLHPFELNRLEYERALQAPFDVAKQETLLTDLFNIAKIHISIYSTTLYDAIGFGMVNFSIQNYGLSRDYAKDLVQDGIALPIEITDDPIAIYNQLCKEGSPESLHRDDFYPAMNRDLIMDVINQKPN